MKITKGQLNRMITEAVINELSDRTIGSAYAKSLSKINNLTGKDEFFYGDSTKLKSRDAEIGRALRQQKAFGQEYLKGVHKHAEKHDYETLNQEESKLKRLEKTLEMVRKYGYDLQGNILTQDEYSDLKNDFRQVKNNVARLKEMLKFDFEHNYSIKNDGDNVEINTPYGSAHSNFDKSSYTQNNSGGRMRNGVGSKASEYADYVSAKNNEYNDNISKRRGDIDSSLGNYLKRERYNNDVIRNNRLKGEYEADKKKYDSKSRLGKMFSRKPVDKSGKVVEPTYSKGRNGEVNFMKGSDASKAIKDINARQERFDKVRDNFGK